jgi:hypothetical protein
MDAAFRIVTKLPLEELWKGDRSPIGSRLRPLTTEEIIQLLRVGIVEFTVADVGHELRWIAPPDCYGFWKSEVKPHLTEDVHRILPHDFPGEYCHKASYWGVDGKAAVVLLEKYH